MDFHVPGVTFSEPGVTRCETPDGWKLSRTKKDQWVFGRIVSAGVKWTIGMNMGFLGKVSSRDGLTVTITPYNDEYANEEGVIKIQLSR